VAVIDAPPADDLDPTAIVSARHAALRRVEGVAPIAPHSLEAADAHPRASAATTAPAATPRARRGDAAELRPPRRIRRRGPAAPSGAAPASRGWFLHDEPDRRSRGLWLMLAFAAMAAAIGVRLVDVQLRQAGSLGAAAAAAHQATVTTPAHRGRIYDRNGLLLASDLTLFAIYADPGVIPQAQRHEDAVALAPVLGISTGRLDELLDQPGDYVPLAHGVTDDTRRRLAQLGIYGIIATPEDRRTYETSPVAGASLASNLLGYVNHDGAGQYGVESYYDALLRGQDGADSTVRDVNGNPIMLGSGSHQAARDGRDLQLGLDSRIQYYAEQALAQSVTQSGAESGQILIMDTQTGSLRAWADYPTYDANAFASASPASIRDLGISGLYEPGSVMKVVTFAGGLSKGVIAPGMHLNEAETVVDGFRIHDWDGRSSHPNITFQWVLDDSLNNGAIQVMQRVGKDDFYTNLLKFGIGSPTGVDLAGETNQPLKQEPAWSNVDYATASFGQQVSVTPVEMLAAINAVANGGLWVQPHAVDAVLDPQTGQQTAVSPTTRRVMPPDAAATLAKMMTGVVEDRGASGFLAKIPSFKGLVGGKTGTASVPQNGHYGSDVISSFVGFLPLNHPHFTMMVILRKPHHCTSNGLPNGPTAACEGAYVAAPVWRQLAQLMVDDWKVTP
jgi:cell division protein FtsI/penicillin-binding protein 2